MPSETPNLKLNHWTPDDYFRLAEINDNFAKIDTAVGALRYAPVKLLDETLTQNVSQWDIDLSGIEWNKYLAL